MEKIVRHRISRWKCCYSTSTDNNGSAIAGLRTDRDNAKDVTLARTQPTIAGSRVTVNLGAVTSGVSAGVALDNDRGVILQVNDTVAGLATSPAGFCRLLDKLLKTVHFTKSNQLLLVIELAVFAEVNGTLSVVNEAQPLLMLP